MEDRKRVRDMTPEEREQYKFDLGARRAAETAARRAHPIPPRDGRLVSSEDVCALLDIANATLDRLVSTRQIPSPIGGRRGRKWDPDVFYPWFEAYKRMKKHDDGVDPISFMAGL